MCFSDDGYQVYPRPSSRHDNRSLLHNGGSRGQTQLDLPPGLSFGPFKFIQSELAPVTPKRTTESIDLDQPEVEKPETASATSEQMEATLLVVDESWEDEWFTITLALVGILVVACLAVLVLLVSCYLCKRKNKQREIFYDSSKLITVNLNVASCDTSHCCAALIDVAC